MNNDFIFISQLTIGAYISLKSVACMVLAKHIGFDKNAIDKKLDRILYESLDIMELDVINKVELPEKITIAKQHSKTKSKVS